MLRWKQKPKMPAVPSAHKHTSLKVSPHTQSLLDRHEAIPTTSIFHQICTESSVAMIVQGTHLPISTCMEISTHDMSIVNEKAIGQDSALKSSSPDTSARPSDTVIVSPAKDSEIAEANRRMQEFLAKKQTGNVTKKFSTTNIESKITNGQNFTDAVAKVDAGQKSEPLNDVDKGTSKPADHKSGQVESATVEEIAEANRRMQEFLATLQVNKAPNKRFSCIAKPGETNGGQESEDTSKRDLVPPEEVKIVELDKGIGYSDVVHKQLSDDMESGATKSAEHPNKDSSSKIHGAEDQSTVDQVKSTIIPLSVQKDSANLPTAIPPSESNKISAANEDEIAAANKRMMEFLAKKQAGNVPKKRFAMIGAVEDLTTTNKKIEEAPSTPRNVDLNKDQVPLTPTPTNDQSKAATAIPKKFMKISKVQFPETSTLVDALGKMMPYPAKKISKAPPRKYADLPMTPLRAAGYNIVRYGSQPPLPCNLESISEGCDEPDAVRSPIKDTASTSESPVEDPESVEAKRWIRAYLNNNYYKRPWFNPLKYLSTLPTENMETIFEVCEESAAEDEESKAIDTSSCMTRETLAKPEDTSCQKTPSKASTSPPPKLNLSSQTVGVCPAKQSELLEVSKKLTELVDKQQSDSIQMKILSGAAKTFSQITSVITTPVKMVKSKIGTPKKNGSPGSSNISPLQQILFKGRLDKPEVKAGTPTKGTPDEKTKSNVALEQPPIKTSSGAISTSTKFVRYEGTPDKHAPVAVTDTVLQQVQVVEHTPSQFHPADPRWFEEQWAHLFRDTAPVVPKMTTIAIPITIALSVPVYPQLVVNALIEYEKEMKAKTVTSDEQYSIHAPLKKKTCLPANLHLFDHVPETFPHAFTPCTTPTNFMFCKRIRPDYPFVVRKDRIQGRQTNLVFPKSVKKSVRFQENADLIYKEPSFDEVVNGGGSGFRILSIQDHNTKSIQFPKYVPPADFCRKQ